MRKKLSSHHVERHLDIGRFTLGKDDKELAEWLRDNAKVNERSVMQHVRFILRRAMLQQEQNNG